MDFLRSVWNTLVGVEEEPSKVTARTQKRTTPPAVTTRRTQKMKAVATPKPAVTVTHTQKTKRAVSPMPVLTLKQESPKPAVTLTNTKSYSMRNQVNNKSSRLTALALLEKNRKNRHTLKQRHKAKTTPNN